MYTHQCARPRRRHRRVVVRSAGTLAGHTHEEIQAWDISFQAAEHLRRLFPPFYAACVADRPMSGVLGAGMAGALWLLIEQEYGLELRWPLDMWTGYGSYSNLRDALVDRTTGERIPASEALTTFEWINPDWMAQWWYFFDSVRPAYCGLDIQASISGDSLEVTDAPTLLLWALCAHTDMSLGIVLEEYLQHAEGIDDEDRIELLRIRALSPATPIRAFFAALAGDIPEARALPDPAQLLAYAFNGTGNPLADTGPIDLDVVHCGDDGEYWPYTDEWLERLGTLQAEATAIVQAYHRWRFRIREAGWPALRAFAARAHRLARKLIRDGVQDPSKPAPLIDVLAEQWRDDDELAADEAAMAYLEALQ